MGQRIKLEDILLSKLKQLKTVNGEVLHALRNSDLGYNKFGEVYFSTIEPNSINAWKRHSKMLINFIVPVGEVRFVFYIDKESGFRTENIGLNRYMRLTVPPGIWFGFKGLSDGLNLICNIADIPHDPNEILRKEIDEIVMDWRI